MNKRIPMIPRDFYKISYFKNLLVALYCYAFFTLPAWASIWVLYADFTLLLKIALWTPLILLTGFGLNTFLWLAHEGGHLCLHKNKYMSMALAILHTTFLPNFMVVGFTVSHWDHHRYTNHQHDDPNYEIYLKYNNFFTRMFISLGDANRMYSRYVFQIALGKPLPFKYKLPFTDGELKAFAWLNIGWRLICTTAVVLLTVYYFLPMLMGYWLPIILVTRTYNGIRPYLEHTNTSIGAGRDSRSRTSWLWTLLEIGNNYHQEHHLYPKVPSYKLPALHDYLNAQNFYDDNDFADRSTFGVVKYAYSDARLPLKQESN